MFYSRVWHCLVLFRKLTQVTFQIIYGYYRLLGVAQPMVSIFGAARAAQSDRYSEMARTLARMFAQAEISVITGGGSGIMEAASCGASERPRKEGASIGIGVRSLKEGHNSCMDEFLVLDYFFARKWLLTHYSKAFIVFPGGFGTLDELMELLTLVKTKTMVPVPIVLMGVEYWTPFVDWLKNEVLKHNYIEEQSLRLFVLTDDPEEAFELARDTCNAFKDIKSEDKENL